MWELQIAVYRSADRLMSLSVHGDMKAEVQALPERTPLKEETHGFFLKYPSSYSAHFFRQWAKEVDRAKSRQDPITRTDGGAPSARSSPLCCGLQVAVFLVG